MCGDDYKIIISSFVISSKKWYFCYLKTIHTMETKFCQSCGMPLTPEILGTNADGSKNEEYCIYCYKDGADAELVVFKRR